ncbi:MAG: acetyltransferase [Gammaproteobacteria bacterium HGW-Gammaproteobacteria-3]|nr:MAG: acetyltransferase [Gammaproteobacteria bacterium HGW-Gammaproteobacteria-3]
MYFDVFNGDADGICALIQLRQARPADTRLITGIKRDIKLLAQVSAQSGDEVLVLDISMESNKTDLDRILNQGAKVFYVDHHRPGEIPDHPALTTLIDTDANTCTSLLVDQHLKGRYRNWAIAAAFGDNLDSAAAHLAKTLALSTTEVEQLKRLGICINYNSYGSSLDDLHFAPAKLYREMAPFASPFDFIEGNRAIYQQLLAGYFDDLKQAEHITPEYRNPSAAVFILPDQAWARRISGVWANELANTYPNRAHAILSHNNAGGYLVSVRAPLSNKTGADDLCASFPSGGGRKAAAGINHLPKAMLSAFIDCFSTQYA